MCRHSRRARLSHRPLLPSTASVRSYATTPVSRPSSHAAVGRPVIHEHPHAGGPELARAGPYPAVVAEDARRTVGLAIRARARATRLRGPVAGGQTGLTVLWVTGAQRYGCAASRPKGPPPDGGAGPRQVICEPPGREAPGPPGLGGTRHGAPPTESAPEAGRRADTGGPADHGPPAPVVYGAPAGSPRRRWARARGAPVPRGAAGVLVRWVGRRSTVVVPVSDSRVGA